MSQLLLNTLLSRLQKEKNISINDRADGDGKRCITVVRHNLPSPPYTERKSSWYTLIILPGQIHVDRHEVEALLRHVWHSEIDFFEDGEE